MTESDHDSTYSPDAGEPIFTAIAEDDPEIVAAHRRVANTVSVFKEHILRPGGHICSAKLRFRDPDLSEETGRDSFFFLWLTDAVYHSAESMFSAEFF